MTERNEQVRKMFGSGLVLGSRLLHGNLRYMRLPVRLEHDLRHLQEHEMRKTRISSKEGSRDMVEDC